jgi:probable rRNA maturation factor
MKVICLWLHQKLPKPNTKILKEFIKDVCSCINFNIPKGTIISVSFLGVEQMCDINQTFLNHNYLTDVICFDYMNYDDFSKDDEIAIELLLSPDIALQRANEHSVPYDYSVELALYIIHGLLHAAGYKDKLNDDRLEMRKKENDIISTLSEKYILNELFLLN